MYPTLRIFLAAIGLMLAGFPEAPESNQNGPETVAAAEYRLTPVKDPEILSDRVTEIWAKMWFPKTIAAKQNLPLLVFLHGNHGTCGMGSNPRRDNSCEYTSSGTCSGGSIPTPNHEGYAYVAENLASHGYVVVSINANRGITCSSGGGSDWGLNLARGRLVLKHLAILKQWATAGGAPTSLGLGADGLISKLDFSQVGLMGHSRGGEGVRAALNQFNDAGSIWPAKMPDLKIRAIFEIGAVDGQTSRVLDAPGVVWNQLLPMCDGDVSDLQGRKPYERMMKNQKEANGAQKSLTWVYGTNHNFYNTEWQESDASSWDCTNQAPLWEKDGGKAQRAVGLGLMSAFFRANVGNASGTNSDLNQNLNPPHDLNPTLKAATLIQRDFTTSPGSGETLIIDDFNQAVPKSTIGTNHLNQNVTITHVPSKSGFNFSFGRISWTSASDQNFHEIRLADTGKTFDLSPYSTIDFRVASETTKATDPTGMGFTVHLVDAAGNLSDGIDSKSLIWIGPMSHGSTLHFQTVRIPVAYFRNVLSSQVQAIRFVFNQTASGSLAIANLRASKSWGLGSTGPQIGLVVPESMLPPGLRGEGMAMHGVVSNTKPQKRKVRVFNADVLDVNENGSLVEVEVESEEAFPVSGSLPTLTVGTKTFHGGEFTDMKTLKSMKFQIPATDYEELQGSKMRIRFGNSPKEWDAGWL
ncbi:MAG: hypothetical protein JNL01_02520 [Bdellovibrionales bacterium]|nr:hypothetical protein [Bdellovibrionales bacterium]